MGWLISAVGAGLICAVLAVVLGQYRPEYRMLVSLGGGVLILVLVLENIQPAVEQVRAVFSLTGMDSRYAGLLMKAVGACFFTQLAGDVCRDAGESAAAAKVEFAGRCAVLVISLPLFAEVLQLAAALIGS